MHKTRNWLIVIAVLVTSIGLFLWWQWPRTVTVVTASRGPAVEAIYATGTVEPSVTLPIASRQAGHLLELVVDEGQTVHKGQLLARLNDSDLTSTVAELAVRANFARQYFDRLQTLGQRNLVAKLDIDRAKADMDAAVASVNRANALRDFMTLTAPADGLIIKRDGEIGQFIPAGQPIFYLSCCAPLRITAQVDEEDIAQVRVGQAVVLRSDALPKQVFDGVVSEITPKGDPVARSYRVRIGLSNPGQLQIGMTVDTNLIVDKRDNVMLLATFAIDNNAVWLVIDNKLHKQAVVTGITSAERTEIVSGLEADNQIVTTLSADFREGQAVRIKTSQP